MYGVMIDSEVGRTASRSSSSFVPGLGHPRDLGVEPLDDLLFAFEVRLGMNSGKVGVLTPVLLNFASRKPCSRSQIAYARGA